MTAHRARQVPGSTGACQGN